MENLTVIRKITSVCMALPVALFLLDSDRTQKAIEICSECLILLNETNQNSTDQIISLLYKTVYKVLFNAYRRISDDINAERCGRKLLVLCNESSALQEEGDISMALEKLVETQNRFLEAKQLFEKADSIKRETGDKIGEANACARVGFFFQKLGEWLKAKDSIERALAIRTQIGDKKGEATDYGNLGTVFQSLGKYDKAIEYLEKALVIWTEIGDREGEAADYGNLGIVFYSLGKYDKAKEYHEKALVIRSEIGHRQGQAAEYGNLGTVFQSLGKYDDAKEYLEKALVIRTEVGDRKGEAIDYGNLGAVFQSVGKYGKAIEYYQKALLIRTEIGDRKGEAADYGNLGTAFLSLGKYYKAEEYLKKALVIATQISERRLQASCYGNLGVMFTSLGKCDKAKEYHEKALVIRSEIGHREGQAAEYGNLGTVFQSLGRYDKAKEYLEKALVIRTEIGDRKGEADDYGKLGDVYQSLGKYDKAKEYLKKALVIRTEIGDRKGEADAYEDPAIVFQSLGKYDKAKEYLEKALVIRTETGDGKGEADDYGELGAVFHSLGKYDKAKAYLEKAFVIRIEIGDRKGKADEYRKLGVVFQSLGKYDKAKEYLEKGLVIRTEIGDRRGEAADYGNLGFVFHSLGKYDKAKECYERALVIRTEIGDRKGEADDYGKLGTVFKSLGKYDKAKEYYEKGLVIRSEIGDRKGEAADCGNLGAVFQSLGKYSKAKEYLEKALVIRTEIGDRKGEADDYGRLGVVCFSLGKYDKAKEYCEKALVISSETGDKNGEAADYENLALVITTEIGDRKGEADDYGKLGATFQSLGKYDKAKEYYGRALVIRTQIGDQEGEAEDLENHGTLSRIIGDYEASEVYLERALYISRDIGDRKKEFEILLQFAVLFIFHKKSKDSLSYLHLCIEKYEELRSFLGLNDEFKTSFLENSGIFPYKLLSSLLCFTGNFRDALYVEELSRARGLSELMAEKYSVETHISADPQTWFGIENILRKENNCTCLYIYFFQNDVRLWILKTSGAIHFKLSTLRESLAQAGLPKDLHLSKVLADIFRSLGILSIEDCEDRSLNMVEMQSLSPEKKNPARLRLLEEEEKVISNLSFCYKIFIAPVWDLLEEPEVIIVPESTLYKVPFAALKEKEGAKYLSDTRRIRLIPSLTTLKTIKDSPEDYHSNTGALIIGNPKVDWLLPLPGARKEAEMVGRLVGVQPLLKEQATKQAVLQRISSVSLIHFAAHGNAETGEIALAPFPSCNSPNAIPPKDAYMLTIADVSRVKVRAKLVVLSCCHSGSGEVRAEGVIGIARAFLGSGARSVLAALWAIPDSATEQLMRQFYEHLAEGESASESLHQAMKWMRNNGFTKVSEWASFTLIGDDSRVKRIDCGYELSELLSGRGGSADTVVDVATVEFRFGPVVLAEKLMFDKTYKKIGIARSHFGAHGYTIGEDGNGKPNGRSRDNFREHSLTCCRVHAQLRAIYKVLFNAYRCISDDINTDRYGKKLLVHCNESGAVAEEGDISMALAQLVETQNRFLEAKQLFKKAVSIKRETGDKIGEAKACERVGFFFYKLGERYCVSVAREIQQGEYNERALAIRTKIGERKGEADDSGNLGAKEYLKKGLVVRTEIGDRKGEAADYGNLGTLFQSLWKCDKAEEYLKKALVITTEIGDRREASCYGSPVARKYDKAREYYEKALVLKTEIDDRREASCYGNLITMFQSLGKYYKAMEYLEKALFIRTEIGDRKGQAYDYGNLGVVFQSLGKYDTAEEYLKKGLVIRTEIGDRKGVADDYGNLGAVSPSLGKYDKAKKLSEIGDKEGEADDYGNLGTVLHAAGQYDQAKEYYEKALAIRTGIGDMTAEGADYGNLVYYFLEELEVIIVLDRTLYEGPFAALSEKEGAKYLSRTHRIRVVPTLTTLKTIQDSPEDYHSNTGALIISNPKVDWLLPLPGAREDAQMVGRLVGVPGLVEEEATKQAVKAEGVIGIARVFLGSGARSMLVALWAIPDSATEQLMSRFYEHLFSGKSASESLHQAMRWMRNNGFTIVSEWASFMLIEDDTRLEFGKQRDLCISIAPISLRRYSENYISPLAARSYSAHVNAEVVRTFAEDFPRPSPEAA
ncbi:Tetratricopeptide repeat protein 28 [Stylophora pistillata]|uniref:Tetratricopeptide repeat protein 28 n=1 Tax=Stylophora pistillata TaxID=50429 RepID=A0A2B4SBY7_STYPI|nr:Tetratricopeptide repeat protein 28 [Stylophora pistillata]